MADAFDSLLSHLRVFAAMVNRTPPRHDAHLDAMLREKFEMAVVEAVARDIKAGGKLRGLMQAEGEPAWVRVETRRGGG